MQPVPPFARILVPYDGSEPARAALRLAQSLAQEGARLTVLTVVDEGAIVAESMSAVTTFDPAPMVEALDNNAKTLLAEAHAYLKGTAIEPDFEIVHDAPVPAVLGLTQSKAFDLVIMGTHARQGVARTFLGSTTEGVLRMSEVPVLTVHTAHALSRPLFSTVLVAIDDSESDAAAALAARLASTEGARVVACHVVESDSGLDDRARAFVHAALVRAGLPLETPIEIGSGEPAAGVRAAAKTHGASLILAGTHGRRGVHRLLLGSVAEQLVRTSAVPVLVAR